jgi:hypothetical protein
MFDAPWTIWPPHILWHRRVVHRLEYASQPARAVTTSGQKIGPAKGWANIDLTPIPMDYHYPHQNSQSGGLPVLRHTHRPYYVFFKSSMLGSGTLGPQLSNWWAIALDSNLCNMINMHHVLKVCLEHHRSNGCWQQTQPWAALRSTGWISSEFTLNSWLLYAAVIWG